jgi:hypothetical protein
MNSDDSDVTSDSESEYSESELIVTDEQQIGDSGTWLAEMNAKLDSYEAEDLESSGVPERSTAMKQSDKSTFVAHIRDLMEDIATFGDHLSENFAFFQSQRQEINPAVFDRLEPIFRFANDFIVLVRSKLLDMMQIRDWELLARFMSDLRRQSSLIRERFNHALGSTMVNGSILIAEE